MVAVAMAEEDGINRCQGKTHGLREASSSALGNPTIKTHRDLIGAFSGYYEATIAGRAAREGVETHILPE